MNPVKVVIDSNVIISAMRSARGERLGIQVLEPREFRR